MLVEVSFNYVQPYARVASKEHVSVSPTQRTRWFRLAGHEGFCGLIELGATVRVKGVYVHPEWRGRGLGTGMTDELLTEAARGPYKAIEVLAYNPVFYEERGFLRKAQLRNGAWKLTKENKNVQAV